MFEVALLLAGEAALSNVMVQLKEAAEAHMEEAVVRNKLRGH